MAEAQEATVQLIDEHAWERAEILESMQNKRAWPPASARSGR